MSDVFVPASAVRARYQISDMTIWRWMRDERMNFPTPIKANSRHRLWRLADLEAWEAAKAEGGADAIVSA
jgi:predicted DNA-binding transcriptional regulator AlpA